MPSWPDVVSEQSIKAALLYKFAQFTDWPLPSPEKYALCVLGRDPYDGALSFWESRTLKDKPVEARYPASPSEAKNCQVLFLNPETPAQLPEWVAEFKDIPVLTVSDQPDAWNEGVMIALSTEANRIVFKIDMQLARKVGIKFRANMLQLAREVR